MCIIYKVIVFSCIYLFSSGFDFCDGKSNLLHTHTQARHIFPILSDFSSSAARTFSQYSDETIEFYTFTLCAKRKIHFFSPLKMISHFRQTKIQNAIIFGWTQTNALYIFFSFCFCFSSMHIQNVF